MMINWFIGLGPQHGRLHYFQQNQIWQWKQNQQGWTPETRKILIKLWRHQPLLMKKIKLWRHHPLPILPWQTCLCQCWGLLQQRTWAWCCHWAQQLPPSSPRARCASPAPWSTQPCPPSTCSDCPLEPETSIIEKQRKETLALQASASIIKECFNCLQSKVVWRTFSFGSI